MTSMPFAGSARAHACKHAHLLTVEPVPLYRQQLTNHRRCHRTPSHPPMHALHAWKAGVCSCRHGPRPIATFWPATAAGAYAAEVQGPEG